MQKLENQLKTNHRRFFDSLASGADKAFFNSDIDTLYAWRNGQQDVMLSEFTPSSETGLFGYYSFHSIKSSTTMRDSLTACGMLHRFLLWIFNRRLTYSYPIFAATSGDGYYYDPKKKTVFKHVSEYPDIDFPDIKTFFEFLTDLFSVTDENDSSQVTIRTEYELLKKHLSNHFTLPMDHLGHR